MTARPRLLVLSSTFPRWPGDPEPGFVFELARHLTHRFEVTVLAPHAPGSLRHEEMDAVKVMRFRYAPGHWEQLASHGGGILGRLRANPLHALLIPPFLLAGAWSLGQLLRREHFDLVHAHWLIPQGATALAVMALTNRRLPLVSTSHGGDIYGLRGTIAERIMGHVLRRSSKITVVSRAMKERALALGADADRLEVLPMGVDLIRRFVPDDALGRESEELLFVGRLVEKKGLAVLLDALPAVARHHPGVRLRVAGDGPLRQSLEQRARALGIAHRVDFLGMISQTKLPALYRRATLLVAPFVVASGGDQEGLGLVTAEAMGCGCPVLASDLPAVRDLICDGQTGCLTPSGDPLALERHLVALLDDAGRRAALAAEARRQVLERFDWQSIAARYGDLLETARTGAWDPGGPGHG